MLFRALQCRFARPSWISDKRPKWKDETEQNILLLSETSCPASIVCPWFRPLSTHVASPDAAPKTKVRALAPHFFAMTPRRLVECTLSLLTLSACGGIEGVQSGPGTGSGDQNSSAPAGALVCPEKVHSGDVDASEAPALAQLQGVTRVEGRLNVGPGALSSLSALRCLREVSGDLTLRGDSATAHPPALLGELAALERVGGALTVDKIAGVRSPNLSALSSVGGSLQLINLPNLVDLAGLEALAQVQGQLMIARNAVLDNLQALGALKEAAEVLILENPSLSRIGGLAALTQVGGRLKLSKNPRLVSLAGLEQITRVGGLVLENNDLLADLNALGKLSFVELDLLLVGNPALASLQGLNAIAQVPPRVEIENNAALLNLDGLSGLVAPGDNAVIRVANNPRLSKLGPWSQWVDALGELHVVSNPELSSLSGLENLRSIAALTLHGPDQLANLQELAQLSQVTGRLSIGARDAWTGVDGLPALQELGELEVVAMKQLDQLRRFETVPTIHSLRLFMLPKLPNLRSFSAFTELRGDLWLDQLDSIPDLGGLERLRSIGGRLVVSKVNAIKNLAPLAALEQSGSLILAENAALENLHGLEALKTLTQLEGGLCLHRNPKMVEFNALSNMTTVAGSYTLTENPLLSTVDGVSGLASIGASLWIDGSPRVETLAPFGALRSIGGRAWSFDDNCPAVLASREFSEQVQPYHGYMGIEVRMMNIKDLKGFENVETIKGGISIKENPELLKLEALYKSRVEGVTVEVRKNPKMDQCHALSIVDNLSFFDGGDIRIWDNLGEDDKDCG